MDTGAPGIRKGIRVYDSLAGARDTLRQYVLHSRHRFALHVGQHMAISVEGYGDRRMPEKVLHYLGMQALAEQRRARVTQTVEPNGTGQPGTVRLGRVVIPLKDPVEPQQVGESEVVRLFAG